MRKAQSSAQAAASALLVVLALALVGRPAEARDIGASQVEKPCCIALAKLNPPTGVNDFTLYCEAPLPAGDGPSPVAVVVPIPGRVKYKRIQRNYTDQAGQPNVYSVCFAIVQAPPAGASYVLPPWPAAIKFPAALLGTAASVAGKMCYGSNNFYQITLPNGAAYAVCADGFATNIEGLNVTAAGAGAAGLGGDYFVTYA